MKIKNLILLSIFITGIGFIIDADEFQGSFAIAVLEFILMSILISVLLLLTKFIFSYWKSR